MSLTLRHLNADTSWLILFENFKILLDPWLFGSQSEFSRYFSTQEHAVKPSIQNINRDLHMQIDAIIISHEFTDHCHEQTLRSLSKTIPVFATTNASNRIRRWNYFQYVYEIPLLDDRPENFTLSMLSGQQPELGMPSTISVGYIREKGLTNLASLHGATCISFLVNNQQWRSLLYVPHGCKQSSIHDWLNQQCNVKVSVLLQGFNRIYNPVWLGGVLNYGCEKAAKLAVAVKAQYWIATHDEDVLASGLVSKFVKRDTYAITDAQIQLNKYLTQNTDQRIATSIHDVQNGDSLIVDLTI
ncbi:unnamed protein product [Rotaria sp. Silwood2]|nr:unnamed protein product [Rotaria sp. Silwood2]CAF3178801.1 unnamed protein product [Rotaria sp. Silwood2]CAF3192023.1 unnamed protein product [Rotaria sp. Silwood2]CAF4283750.1 unnamed protein product [Rotaria sp. Silwood2]CAF4516165.1 unnamed protein product [Rotaria sp. Silwood2]